MGYETWRMAGSKSSSGWIRPNMCGPAFIFSAIAMGLTLVGMVCAIIGMAILPKCRYGERECYFRVKECAYQDEQGHSDGCMNVLKSRAIEGSNDYSAEQLAIPILATVVSCVPAFLTVLGTMFDKALGLLETSKVLLATNMVFLVLGIRAIQDLTFDCRWWGNQNHGNAEACHDGFNLYIAATTLLAAAHLVVLIISVRFVENERYTMASKHEVVSLTSRGGMADEAEEEAMANL